MAQFYTLEEAARVLGMGPDELKQKAQRREVRAFMDGGTWQFRAADVDELARRRGMGSDPDLSLSDLDLGPLPDSGSRDELDLSAFETGAIVEEPAGSADDLLVDDRAFPTGPSAGGSSTIIGMTPSGKKPTDSDVRLVPEDFKDASDSDVRLSAAPPKPKPPKPGRKPPGDSDVTLGGTAPGDSDVRLGGPADSDVTLADTSRSASDVFLAARPGDGSSDDAARAARPGGAQLGSSAEVPRVGPPDDSDSDFGLTPSSVVDALEPESGSDFELTALDSSDEFESTPLGGPGDSDVTAAEPSTSGINLGRPSDSGIDLQAASGLGGTLHSTDSIELAPLDEPEGAPKRPQPKVKPAAAQAKAPARSPGETLPPGALKSPGETLPPGSVRSPGETLPPGAIRSPGETLPPGAVRSPGATLPPGAVRSPGATLPPGAIRSAGATLPPGAVRSPGATLPPGATSPPGTLRADKDIFEDTDFEVAALEDEADDRTVQLEAASSEYDLDEGDSGSEVFAIDEDDVDLNAATALAGDSQGDEEEGRELSEIDVPTAESHGAWQVESEGESSAARAVSPMMSRSEATAEWGTLWVSFLGVGTFLMLLVFLISIDLIRNLYEYQGTVPVASDLASALAGVFGGS